MIWILNCLFMDKLSKDDLIINKNAVKQKAIEVLKNKNKNLNIIDLNNENQVVEQTEPTLENEDNSQNKEEVKQVLIQVISNKMRDYLNDDKELKLEDLQDLEIPNYDVNVSISSNLAIITVNGYSFKLDSDFNLSDS